MFFSFSVRKLIFEISFQLYTIYHSYKLKIMMGGQKTYVKSAKPRLVSDILLQCFGNTKTRLSTMVFVNNRVKVIRFENSCY